MTRRGFSLIEMALVILILGILAGAVTLRISGPMRNARMDAYLRDLRVYDDLTRTMARRRGEFLHVVMDLDNGRLQRRTRNEHAAIGQPMRTSSEIRVAELRLADRHIPEGTAALEFTPQGFSPTYALRVLGPNGREAWVMWLGLSGESWILNEQEQLANIWSPAPGDDSH